MDGLGADALVVTHLPNVFYLCGFTGSNAVLLVLADSLHLFTDGRYTIQAREEAPARGSTSGEGPSPSRRASTCGRKMRPGTNHGRMRSRSTSACRNGCG